MALLTTYHVILLLVKLLAGFHANCNVFVSSENIEIPEDIPVGSTVVSLGDFVDDNNAGLAEDGNGTFWSVNVIAGDDLGRFEASNEDLALVVAAPLDYELYSRYNLSVELTNTGDTNVLYVNLTIVVTDVPTYPPFYDERCETPVLPDGGRAGNSTVATGDGFYWSANGEDLTWYGDVFQFYGWDREVANVTLTDKCGWRFFRRSDDLGGDANLILTILQGPQQGRVKSQCRNRELEHKGNIAVLDSDIDDTLLPQWVQDNQWNYDGSGRYVTIMELNEIWSSSPYWLRCGANVTLFGGTILLEYTFQYNVTGCPEGRYGVFCDEDCVCKNGARCHGFNGACKCRPGWRGRACDVPWSEVVIVESPGDSVIKYVGTNLTLTCLAPHIRVANMTWVYQRGNESIDTKIINEGAAQNSSIGFLPISESANGRYTCVVTAGGGERFNVTFVLNATECPPNYHGEVCDQVCDCQHGGTCGRWEGCVCPAGRHGDRCEHVCPAGTFGLNCDMTCYCQNNASCDAVNGSCTCAEGQSGEFCQNIPIPEENQENQGDVLVIVLTSVLPTVVIIGFVAVGILVRRGLWHPKNTGHTECEMVAVMELLSSWEVDKENIRLEHMIGQGEFGHVVRGRLRLPEGYEVLVAAKSIRPDRMTESAVRDFRREMSLLARVHEEAEGHPNVVKFYGVVTKSEPQYILVEYAGHEELRRYLWSLREERKVTGNGKLLERLGFASDVASGLSELARLKIVHRDIAARNVVISDRKVAKIADFGLARDVYMSSAYDRTYRDGQEELLPLKWMAVESLRDGVYTCESDVWSFGVLLWEIASFGEEPRYPGPMHPDVCTLLGLLRKGVRLQQPEDCPPQLYRVIRSCWLVDPSRRPTPEELSRTLDLQGPARNADVVVNPNI